ncbi:MAG: MarR family transcriptional regulator [Pseudomonadota bacterium]
MIEDDIAFLIDRLLRAANHGYHVRTKAAKGEKIWPADGLFLVALSDLQPATMSALSGLLMRDKSQLTRTANKLEEKGFLIRATAADDARKAALRLTAKGEEAVANIRSVTRSTILEMLAPLTQSERKILGELLQRLAPIDPR